MSIVLIMIAGFIAGGVSVAAFGYTQTAAYLWLSFMISNLLMFIAGKKDE